MNEINETPNITPTSATTPVMPEHHHKYWAIILVLMGITLAAAMYFVYKRPVPQYTATAPMPATESNVEDTKMMEQPTETSGSVELDQKMTTPNVTDDILNEIDDVEKTDPSASFSETQITDLQ